MFDLYLSCIRTNLALEISSQTLDMSWFAKILTIPAQIIDFLHIKKKNVYVYKESFSA